MHNEGDIIPALALPLFFFSLKLECDKLASEKSEMQRHYVMVSQPGVWWAGPEDPRSPSSTGSCCLNPGHLLWDVQGVRVCSPLSQPLAGLS